MTESDVADSILGFIRSEIAYPGTEVGVQDDLFDSGVLDSLKLLQLVLHIETAYPITVAAEDLDPAVFGRVGSLSAFVMRKIERRP